MSLTRIYCPTCEESQLDAGESRCAWCGGELTKPQAAQRERRRHSKWTDAQINAAYAAYLDGHSCRKIASVIWEKLGFATPNSCANSLWREFKLMGMPTRSRSAVTTRRNFKHGRATRASRLTGGTEDAEYRRWFKQENGRYNPKCQTCERPAMDGDEFCFAHSPATSTQRNAICAAMRENSELFAQGERHPMAKLTGAQVAQIKTRAMDRAADLADEYGVSKATIYSIRAGKNWAHIEPAVAA